jgi:hypothetical protein
MIKRITVRGRTHDTEVRRSRFRDITAHTLDAVPENSSTRRNGDRRPMNGITVKSHFVTRKAIEVRSGWQRKNGSQHISPVVDEKSNLRREGNVKKLSSNSRCR